MLFDMEGDFNKSHNNSIIIGPDVYIGNNVTIGDDTLIYPGVKILDDTVIGSNVVIKSNTVIGGDGFGYAVRPGFPPMKIPHLGNVVIGNNVDIGSNTAIDKATFGSTFISDFVKIDNGVHIAHNCKVGKRTLVIANAELSGSVTIGHDSWIAPNASVKESVTIGNNVLVGIGSVVLKDLPDNAIAFGAPAKIIRYQNQVAT
jgi:UDP-3-O-[3-hydroxymyristoyl] glucosamine N-acyltransferase